MRVSRNEQPIFSIGAVERMVGIAAATIRNWEERFGLITPERGAGGRRLYTRTQVEQLRFLKGELERGLQPADAHRLLAEGTAPAEPSPRDGHVEADGALILLAERDPYAAEFAALFLGTEGYSVIVVFDASEAKQVSLQRRPDLAIVELTVSGGSGIELCTWLKAHGVPSCLAISGLQAEAEALASGADAFLQKPLEPLGFLATARALLRSSSVPGESGTLRG